MKNQFLEILFFALIIWSFLTNCSEQKSKPKLEIKKEKQQLSLVLSHLAELDSIEIRLYSDRNTKISKRSDKSKNHPEGFLVAKKSEVWHPIVDVETENELKGMAVFNDSVSGKYSINGMFYKDISPLKKVVEIDGKKLMYWENSLTLEPKGTLKEFYLSCKFPISGNSFKHSFNLLSEDWSGNVQVFGITNKGSNKLGNSVIEPYENPAVGSPLKTFEKNKISRDRLLASLRATIQFTLRMQDKNPNSPTYGGLNLFYDYEVKTYRRPHWIWASGPSIKLLLDAANNIPEFPKSISKEHLKEVAIQIGNTSKKFQVKDPNSPINGIVTSRWKEIGGKLNQHAGFEEFYSIADALFLVGWGWMPIYRETGESTYLEDSKLMVESAQKLLDAYEIIPMDYIVSEKKWKDYTISEAGFGPEGICEVYIESKDETVKAIGELYMSRLLNRFQQEDGLWARKFNFNPEKTIPSLKHTRGQGWAMEGLISSYTMTKDVKYLKLSERMAAMLIKYQNKAGYWSYNFDKPASEVGISEKGTALWSLLFYRLYEINKNPIYLETARKALTWCLDNQYMDSDIEGHGGLVGITSQSGVTYRSWYPLACSYTSAFFGLAVLEELKLQKN